MRLSRIIVPAAIVILSVLIVVYRPAGNVLHSYTVNGRTYYFMNSFESIMSVPVEPGDREIAEFFANHSTFTIAFDGSSPADNGMFAKEGFNIARRIVRFYGDLGIVKSFEAKEIAELNGSEKALIVLEGPETGSGRFGVFLDGNVVYVSGRTKQEFSLAAERLSLAALGLSQNSSSEAPEAQ